jgi:hypothetical protein
MDVHPDRYSTGGVVQRKRGVVLHTNEGSDGSYASLKALLARPGDRPIDPSQPNGRKYGSAYHSLSKNDPTGAYDQVLPAAAGPYAAPPVNKTFWHHCIPGRAGQTRAQWLEDSSRQGILGAASFVFDKSRQDGFPLVRISAADLLNGAEGYCDHGTIASAYPASTTHWDVGPGFPWDVFAADLAALVALHTPPPPPTNPLEEDDMAATLWRHPQFLNVFLIGAGPAINVSPEVFVSLTARGVPVIVEAHDQLLKACITQSGLALSDLVAAG